MNRFVILIMLFAPVVLSIYLSPIDNIGVSLSNVDGTYSYSASSSIFVTIASFITGVIIFIPKQKNTINKIQIVGIFRRFLSFILDFLIVLFSLASVLTLPVLIIEASYTDSFSWSFSRDFSRDIDGTLASFSAMISFYCLFYYHYKHLLLNKQTIGQYIMGISILFDAGSTISRFTAIERVFYSFVSLCFWPITLFAALRAKDKLLWVDQLTDSRARNVAYYS